MALQHNEMKTVGQGELGNSFSEILQILRRKTRSKRYGNKKAV